MVKFTVIKNKPAAVFVDTEKREVVAYFAQLSLVDVWWLPGVRRLKQGGWLVGWLFLYLGRMVVVYDDAK